jgi:NAD-dependent deacetylase
MTNEMSLEHTDQLRKLIDAAQRIVVFTGAGISTESGIPDFRGPNGVWKTSQPIDFSDFVASEETRKESWRRKFSGANPLGRMDNAEPNTGHIAIAKLVALNKVTHVITQNVDGLHQKSGIADDNVIELHGNANYATCLDCGEHYELESIRQAFSTNETIPYCDRCNGIVKTATISFGQSMPIAQMERAQVATLDCDLFIAIGSSLVVYPAAGFPRIAKQNGAELVIINNQATDLDSICDLVLHYPIGATLSAAVL